MANRYWVGGSGTWDATTTTNWSATSGGAGGASVPTASDSVFFDQAGTYTVSCAGGLTCLNFTVSAGTVSFPTGGSPTWTVSGSFSIKAGTSWTSGGSITFNSTTTGNTITTNGVALDSALRFDGIGGSWALQSAVTTNLAGASAVVLINGTLDLNGYTLTLSYGVGSSFLTSAGTKNLTFNGGTIAIASSNSAFNNAAPTGFTTTAGTGTGSISLSSGSPKTFVGGGATYNCTLNQGGSGALTVSGANTFNNITATYTATAATSIRFTVSTTNTFANWNASGTTGKNLTITATGGGTATLVKSGGGIVSADYLTVSSLTASPSSTWYAGANSTNNGGNTGWTFSAPPVTSNNGNFFMMFN